MRNRLKDWYEGEFVPWEKDPNSPLVVIGGGDYRRSLSARVLRTGVEFYSKHWQWCIGTTIAVIAITIQFMRAH